MIDLYDDSETMARAIGLQQGLRGWPLRQRWSGCTQPAAFNKRGDLLLRKGGRRMTSINNWVQRKKEAL